MSTLEQKILQKIDATEVEQKDVRNRVVTLKRNLLDAESELIACNIRKERLVEELRVLRAVSVSHELTDREQDIERFKLVLPELLKRKP